MLTQDQIAALLTLELRAPANSDLVEAAVSGWHAYARPHQRIHARRRWTNLEAGRGGGKTRTGAEHTLDVMEMWGDAFEGVIGSQTRGTLRRDLIKGPSGLITCARGRGYKLRYLASEREIIHPSGARLNLISGEVEDDARGLSMNYAWLDELAHWQYAKGAFDNVDNALRANAPAPGPHGLITSTPKRRSVVTSMLHDPARAELFDNVSWSSYENAANVAEGVFKKMEQQYGNSWKAQQELWGKAILDAGASWSKAAIEADRFLEPPKNVKSGLISIDPSVTNNVNSDATGIVAIMEGTQTPPSYYVVADATVDGGGGREWALAALRLHEQLVEQFDVPITFLIESNQGGIMPVTILKQVAKEIEYGRLEIDTVHASDSKVDRADVAAVFYEQHRVHHCGHFPELEREMTQWVPKGPKGDSPDHMDALVHGLLHYTKADPDERDTPWYVL